MTENHSAPALPENSAIVETIRAGLVKLLPPEDLAQVDLDGLDAGTSLLSLPVDSVVLMALMTEIEDEFRVFIAEEEAFSFNVIGDIAEYVRARLLDRSRRSDGV